jgi:hypothetical protein
LHLLCAPPHANPLLHLQLAELEAASSKMDAAAAAKQEDFRREVQAAKVGDKGE